MKKVMLSSLVVLAVLWNCGTVFAKATGKGSQGKQAKKEHWKSELPPAWKSWNNAKRQQWEHGLEGAKNGVRKHAETRLNAALRALEMTARKGVPLHHAEEMAKAGLEQGVGPLDFEPLGKFVVERIRKGAKGQGLSEAIHQEINRRQQERKRLRQQMKEKVKQRQENRERVRKEQKQRKELGKPQKGSSLRKGGEEQGKGLTRHTRSHLREREDKGKGRAMKTQKGGGGRKGRR